MIRPLALVVLAAGASRRLGSCKALVSVRTHRSSLGGAGETITPLAQLLESGRSLGSDETPPPRMVVTGKDHDAISAALRKGEKNSTWADGVEIVHNERWQRGRTGGIALAHTRRPGADLCIAPVDVPLVSASVFAALATAWRKADAPARGWLAPSIDLDGRRRFGHPIIIGRDLLDELVVAERLDPDLPLRSIRERADPRIAVAVRDRAILDDLDRPGDMELLHDR